MKKKKQVTVSRKYKDRETSSTKKIQNRETSSDCSMFSIYNVEETSSMIDTVYKTHTEVEKYLNVSRFLYIYRCEDSFYSSTLLLLWCSQENNQDSAGDKARLHNYSVNQRTPPFMLNLKHCPSFIGLEAPFDCCFSILMSINLFCLFWSCFKL